MNIVQLQEQLKNFSQDQLVKEMQMPSGTAPQFLVLGEIMRRQKMQQDFSAQQTKGQPQSTVAEDAIAASGVPQGGIASMARAMAPQTDMAQSTGVQAMAAGGPVKKMQAGGVAKTDPAIIAMANRFGMSVDEYLRSVGEEQAARIEEGAARRSLRDRMVGMEPSGEGVTMPTQEDLDRAYNEDRFAFGASRPLVAPTADLARPDVPMMEGRLIGRSPVATPALAGLPAVADMMPRGTRRLSPEQLAAMEAAQPAAAPPMVTRVAPGAGRAGVVTALPRPAERPKSARQLAFEEARASGTTDPLATMVDPVFTALGDFGGALAGRTVEEQAAIDAERAAAAAGAGPAFERAGRGAPTLDELLTEEQAARVVETQEQPAAPAADTTSPGGGAGGAGGGIASAGGTSSFEQELMDALGRREKAANQDKWLALAQVGLNMMSSTQPTLLGAVGEAGLKGVEAARSARDQYDKDRLDLMGAIEQARQARAAAVSRAAGGASSGGISGIGELGISAGAGRLLTQINADIERLNAAVNDPFLVGAIEAGEATPEQEMAYAAAKQKLDATVATREAILYGGAIGPQMDDETYANLSD